jgi:hypothetical protein
MVYLSYTDITKKICGSGNLHRIAPTKKIYNPGKNIFWKHWNNQVSYTNFGLSNKSSMSKKVDSLTVKGADGIEREYWYDKKLLKEMKDFQADREYKMFTGTRGMDEFGKAMRDQHNLVTEKTERIMWLMNEEESYDIPPSERSKLLNEVKSEDKDEKWWKDFIMGEPRVKRPDPRKHKFHMFEEAGSFPEAKDAFNRARLEERANALTHKYIAGVDPYIKEYPYIPAETHKTTFLDMGEESTPKSPDHRGRLRPGKGILEQIRESGNTVEYRTGGFNIKQRLNELFDFNKNALFTPPGVDKRERCNSVKYLKLSTLTQKLLDPQSSNT